MTRTTSDTATSHLRQSARALPRAMPAARTAASSASRPNLAGTRRVAHEEKYELAEHSMAVLTLAGEGQGDALPA